MKFGMLTREEASSLVEYSIVCMVLFTLLIGIAVFSQALYSYHFVAYAAREGTRWASVNGATCAGDGGCTSPAGPNEVRNYVKNLAPPGIDSSNLTVSATWPSTSGVCNDTDDAPGCPVDVHVSYQFNLNLPLVSDQLTLSSSSEMTITH